jgi:hypothetical protein
MHSRKANGTAERADVVRLAPGRSCAIPANMGVPRLHVFALISTAALLACAACASEPAPGALSSPNTSAGGNAAAVIDAPQAFAPPATGAYAGVYEVPTVKPELAAAAKFPTPEVNWTLLPGNTAKLDYNLPSGLVGGKVGVEFQGPIDTAGMKASLTGKAGTAECSWSTGKLACHEVMRGILPLNPDMAIVRERALAEYAGPVQDRLDVVGTFGTDPIGVVTFGADDLIGPGGEAEGETGGHRKGRKKDR